MTSLNSLQHKELTNEDSMELEAQRKDEERQEVGEKLKRFHSAGNDKGFFFI